MSKYQDIYLVGFRASGKTTLGKHISSRYGLRFLDTDDRIQKQAGMSIESMVALHGWDYFRDMEEKIFADTTILKTAVVATGGGVILRQTNRDILKKDKYLTVYLKADPDLVLSRLNADPHPGQRPPLSRHSLQEEIVSTLAHRDPLYRECADLVLDAGFDAQMLAARVWESFNDPSLR
ncbi:MAG: shikimate kinase [Desulfonatronovibrio sp.]